MAPLPVISGRQAVKALEKFGFSFTVKGKRYDSVSRRRTTSLVPDYKDLDRGTLPALIRGAGITVEGFFVQL